MKHVNEPMKVCKLFGATAAVSGIRDAIPLIHSPCGCMFYIRAGLVMHDRIDSRMLCSDISQNDIIYGGEARLKESIIACQEAHNPELVVVLGSCGPSLIGDDIEAVAHQASMDKGINVIAIDCAGFRGDQVSGFKDALLKILSLYALDDITKEDCVVNIIGVIPGYDYRWRYDILSLINTLSIAGLKTNAVLGGFSSTQQIKNVGRASLNIVLSELRGREIAEFLYNRFKTPYIITPEIPYGMQNTLKWVELLAQYEPSIDISAVKHAVDDKIRSFEYAQLGLMTNYIVSTSVAIVAEPCRSFSLARFLAQEIGVSIAAIAVTESDPRTIEWLRKSLRSIGQDSCELLIDADAHELHSMLEKVQPSIIYGSSFEKYIADKIGASLIKINYPVNDQVIITERPYMGISGINVIMEDFINALIDKHF